MPLRQELLAPLKRIYEEHLHNKEVFKARAYKRAMDVLSSTETPVSTIDDLKQLPGWGKSLIAKAEEWIKTGHIAAADAIDTNTEAMAIFLDIAGVGPVKAAELVDAGLRTITDLEAKRELLNAKQLIGLRYYHDFKLRIPRKEMEAHAALIRHVIDTLYPQTAVCEIVGSYRRGAKNSGDIDVLVTAAKPDTSINIHSIIEALKSEQGASGYLCDDLAHGDKKYMGVCRLKRHKTHRRFDLLVTSPEQFPFALLYFTGSGEFNIEMRNIALSKGYSLSEYGLKPLQAQAQPPLMKNERDIFVFLNLEWVEPKDRAKGALRSN